MEGIAHHLIDIMEPLNKPYSAGDFVKDAKICIEKIQNKGKPVIISGGTWFYIKCLLDEKELHEISENPKLRQKLEKYDTKTLWNMLNDTDKKRAEAIHPNNKERIIRAIEMAEALNGSVSDAKRKENAQYQALWFSNNFIDAEQRKELYKRINLRVDKMIEQGLYYEWEKMTKKHGRTKVLENTIGYKEFFELKDGIYSNLDEAVTKIKQRTRNFAKRQLTFFRQMSRIIKIKDENDILGQF